MSAEELNRMLEECLVREKAWEAVSRLDEGFLGDFGLSDQERAALDRPTPGELAAIGVHPMLAMWGSFMRNPGFAEQMSAAEYFRGREVGGSG